MNDPQTWAIAYLAARRGAPWTWADDGDVLAWNDGTTVAFRQEIIHILEWLIPHGWPPFGALVWLLAACRGKLPPRSLEFSDRVAGEVTELGASSQLDLFRHRLREMHATVESGLVAISQLPPDLRASWKAKATLAEMLFGEATREGSRPDLLNAVLDVFRSGALTDAMLNDPGAPAPDGGGEWTMLHQGLARVTPEAIRLRLQTGLDAIPQPVPLSLPPAARVRLVVDELRADAEHAGLARLVRDFMAAIQLPRRLSEQDEMPIGGFADITNRGNPDRLLLSELAHDDLTLAVRIALNEALYLRREPPAKQPPSPLAVLLDSGVRVWGVPRALAAAAALALVARGEAHARCAVFRASGAQIQPVDLLSKAGVIAHLSVLEPHAHPGPALAAFRARLEEEERPEAVLITHRDVFADPDFQRDLMLAGFEDIYLALVDREGGFTLRRFPRSGAPLCEARVNVDDLFPCEPGRRPVAPLIDRAAHPELPLVLSTEPFPFLLPVRGKVQKAILLRGGGGACVMQDRRLLVWRSNERGARTLASELPRGSTLWFGEHEDGSLCVVKTFNNRRRLACWVVSKDGVVLHSHQWQFSERVYRVESRSDVIFIIHNSLAEVRDMATGQSLATVPVSRMRSHGRYFFEGPDTWCVLSWNGQALRLDPLVLLEKLRLTGIVRVFNHQDFHGPWVLMINGDIHNSTGNRVMQIGPIKPVARVAEDGRGLLVAGAVDGGTRVVDLRSLTSRAVRGPIRDADWILQTQPPTWAVRVRIRRIAALSNGMICLETSQNQWLSIHLAGRKLVLQPPVTAPSATDDIRYFEPIKMPNQPGYSLKVACWPDGRRAWLDSRGMLHLRCAKRDLPEVTIVLCQDQMLPVWTTNGLSCGGPFFCDDRPSSSIAVLWNCLRAFTDPS